MELRISFERGLQPQSAKLDLVGREWAARRFQNYQQAQAWYPAMRSLGAAALPGAIYDYVIVTTNAIQSGSSKLDDFVAHKELKGLSVLVITEDEYAAVIGPAPNGTAEKIRKWLQDNYLSMQTRYVLLIGNPHPSSGDVPMKMCWPRLYATSYTSYKESPTDHYYADLTGNWDLNGDNYFGDYDNDQGVGGVDFTSELYVGRIPVYTSQAGWAATLDSILQKIIDYENDPAAAWRQSALLPMSFSDASTDGAVLAQEFRDDHLSPLGFSAWTMYQQGSGACGANSSYSSDQELRGGTGVRDRWAANDYGLVMWWGHGSTSGAYVGYGGCWDDDGTGNGQIMESSNAASLDDTHPSVVYLNSCLNGYPESTSNLGYALLKKGAIGTVSASRVSWYLVGPWFTSRFFADNAAIGYYFMADVASGTTLGEALFEQKSQMSWFFDNESWMNLMDFNLFGDPALSINPAAEEPTATPTPTLSATATATPTTTPTATSTSTATLTATATATGSATATPSATASATVTPTATWTFTSTPTPTITSTISPTASPTFTATQVATATPTRTASVTPSSVFTATPVFTLPSTATPSATPSSIPDGGEEELDPLQAGTYDDNHEGLIYEGDWVIRAGSKLYGGGEHVSSQRGNSVRFAFRGSRFSLRYASLAGRAKGICKWQLGGSGITAGESNTLAAAMDQSIL